MPDRKAKYILEAEDRTKLALKSAEKNLKSFKSSIGRVSGALAALGSAVTFNAVIEATRRQEMAMAQLEQRIKSTGGIAGLSSAGISDFAAELQKLTTFGDEAVLEMQSLLLTFTNIRGGVFEDTTRTILDMSVAMGQDLKTSALAVGKALNDPVKGLTALSRVGVQFTESQKEQIKALQESGKVADAQRVILQELQVEFGGAAEAAANTFGGALDQLGNAFGDLLEQKGGLNDARDSIKELTAALQDPATAEGMNTLIAGSATMAGATARYIAEIVIGVKELGEIAARAAVGAQDELTELQKRLEFFQSLQGTSLFNRTRVFGPDGLIEVYDEDEINGEIKRLESLINVSFGDRKTFLKPESQSTPDNPTGAGYGIDTGGKSPAGSKQPDRLQKQFETTLQGMQRQLAMLDRTTKHERTLWEVQNGRFKDLSDQQKKALLDAASASDQRKQEIDDLSDLKKADAEMAAAVAARNQELENQAQTWRDQINPVNSLQRQMEELDLLLEKGKISWENYSEAMLQVTDEMDGVGEKSKETADKMSEFAVQAAHNMEGALSGEFFDIMQGNFDDMGTRFKSTLDRMVADLLASQLLESLTGDFGKTGNMGGMIGSAASWIGSLFHQGGIAGAGAPSRAVPALAFAGAPRYHDGAIAGLKSNEVPAILERGEEVLTKNDPRHRNNSGTGTVNLTLNINNPIDPAGFKQSEAQLGREAARQLDNWRMRNT